MEKLNTEKKLLVEEHLSLVKTIVKSTIGMNESVQGLGYDDLFQIGCEALCHAALQYSGDRGASFSTFASVVIHNHLISHCRQVNRIQYPLEYLDAPMKDSDGLTYSECLSSENRTDNNLSDLEACYILAETSQHYTGICRKGIEALKLRCLGHTSVEIAAFYGVKPNHVAAWISRAGNRLRNDKEFVCLLRV